MLYFFVGQSTGFRCRRLRAKGSPLGQFDKRVELTVAVRDARLFVVVRDDGVGGADPSRGSGLIGLIDRIEAADGTLTVISPPAEAPPCTSSCRSATSRRFYEGSRSVRYRFGRRVITTCALMATIQANWERRRCCAPAAFLHH